MSASHLFYILVLLLPVWCLAVGPDLRARTRLLRDLPIGLTGGGRLQPKQRDKTLINMSLSVRGVDLDEARGLFSTSGWMSLRWHDPRYPCSPDDYDGLTSVHLPFSKVWAPEVILRNSAEEERFTFRQVGLVHSDGRFLYLMAVHTRSGCGANFDGFPFGVQHCQLRFGSWVNTQYEVEYRVAENETVALDDFESHSGWRVMATQARIESRQYPLIEEPTNIVVFDFAFKRESYFDPKLGKVVRVSYFKRMAC